MTFHSWPNFDQDEIDAVAAVLTSGKVNYWTGEEGRLFEKEFADFAETEYAVAVSNGTVALELALIALEIGRGDEVIVTSRTFLASASAIVTVGARPVFADVDRNSQNITAETIEAVLSPRTKAVLCVHLAGWPCDMDPIMVLAEKHNLFVIRIAPRRTVRAIKVRVSDPSVISGHGRFARIRLSPPAEKVAW